jgi:hypothetical protein
MMRHFNTTGLCVPEKDYMVDLSSRLEQIKDMVHKGDYFTINRGSSTGRPPTVNKLST